MNYPHVYNPKPQSNAPQSQNFAEATPQKKELTTEEKIGKIFFMCRTLEKDVAALLHAQGLQSSNRFLNQS